MICHQSDDITDAIDFRGVGARAISSRGHTCRGRVRQKAQKKVELVEQGNLK